jgi:hypothetical protein
MQRVLSERRQVVVACPRCEQLVGLWLCLMPETDYQRMHHLTDITASLSPPEERADAMRRAADALDKTAATPWVTCLFCGYDDHYVIQPPSDGA